MNLSHSQALQMLYEATKKAPLTVEEHTNLAHIHAQLQSVFNPPVKAVEEPKKQTPHVKKKA